MLDNLTPTERETIILMASHGMNVYRVAKASFCSRKTVYDRLRNIHHKTGINPADFWGLKKLVEYLEKENA